jgi:hypothetical protein
MMIKGVHAVNNPRIVSYAYSLLRPFIPKKVKERVGSNRRCIRE